MPHSSILRHFFSHIVFLLSFMSSLMLSCQLFLGLLLLLSPCICMFNILLAVSSSSFLNTLSSLSEEGCHWFNVMLSSFLMWSFLVLPLAHLSILISVVCSFCVSFFLPAQHSKINHSSVSPRRGSLYGK